MIGFGTSWTDLVEQTCVAPDAVSGEGLGLLCRPSPGGYSFKRVLSKRVLGQTAG